MRLNHILLLNFTTLPNKDKNGNENENHKRKSKFKLKPKSKKKKNYDDSQIMCTDIVCFSINYCSVNLSTINVSPVVRSNVRLFFFFYSFRYNLMTNKKWKHTYEIHVKVCGILSVYSKYYHERDQSVSYESAAMWLHNFLRMGFHENITLFNTWTMYTHSQHCDWLNLSVTIL